MAQDGTHVQLVLGVTEHGQGSLNPVPAGVTQEELAASLREAVRAHPICGLIIVAESWAYVPPRADHHALRQLE